MSVETLQTLSCSKFVLAHFAKVRLRLIKNDPTDLTRPKPKLDLDLPPICQLLRSSHPLWMFKLCESVIERYRLELHAWLNNDRCFPEVLAFHIEIDTLFRTIVWKNLQLDAVKTALNLANDSSLILDYRLAIAVHYGLLDVAKQLCENNLESNFAHLNAIADYRRVAMGFLQPIDIAITPANHIRPLPFNLLKMVPADRLLARVNFMEALQRVITELVWDLSDDGAQREFLDKFLKEANRDLSRLGPIMLSTLISTFCHSFYRCEKLFHLAQHLLGSEAAVDVLLEQWGTVTTTPVSARTGRHTVGASEAMIGVLLHVCRHHRVLYRLFDRLQILEGENFPLNHDCLLTMAQRNDFAMQALMSLMAKGSIVEFVPSNENDESEQSRPKNAHFNITTLRQILGRNGFELFHSMCYCNAWRTVDQLAMIFENRFDGFTTTETEIVALKPEPSNQDSHLENEEKLDDFTLLAIAREFGCILAACKRGNFLIIERLTRKMTNAVWCRFFKHKHYDAFYTACKMGHTALVEWFGAMCAKYDQAKLYEEAHHFSMRLLEVEAKSLQNALDNLHKEHEAETGSREEAALQN